MIVLQVFLIQGLIGSVEKGRYRRLDQNPHRTSKIQIQQIQWEELVCVQSLKTLFTIGKVIPVHMRQL